MCSSGGGQVDQLRAALMDPAASAAAVWAHSGFGAVDLNELVVSVLAVALESCVLSLGVPTVVVLKEHAVHFGIVSNDVNLSDDFLQFGTASTMYAFSPPGHRGWTGPLSCLL